LKNVRATINHLNWLFKNFTNVGDAPDWSINLKTIYMFSTLFGILVKVHSRSIGDEQYHCVHFGKCIDSWLGQDHHQLWYILPHLHHEECISCAIYKLHRWVDMSLILWSGISWSLPNLPLRCPNALPYRWKPFVKPKLLGCF
jgi:hypothetical protein